jgi:head-tail adaptor
VFWQRVDIQTSTEVQTATGNPRLTWADFHVDVEARVLPLVVDEKLQVWATPEDDAYEVQLRGAHPDIRPRMRVVVGSDVYDIRHIVQPPPFGTPTTVLGTVRVTP